MRTGGLAPGLIPARPASASQSFHLQLPRPPSIAVHFMTFKGLIEGEISFQQGAIIQIFDDVSLVPWWKGQVVGQSAIGIFPSNYVERLPTGGERGSAAGTGQLDAASAATLHAESLMREVSNLPPNAPDALSRLGPLHERLLTSHVALQTESSAAKRQYGRWRAISLCLRFLCDPIVQLFLRPTPQMYDADALNGTASRLAAAQATYQRLMELHRRATSAGTTGPAPYTLQRYNGAWHA